MDQLKYSSPALGIACPFCCHSKCQACVEVSSNVLACCQCRARAISRLTYLENARDRKGAEIDEKSVVREVPSPFEYTQRGFHGEESENEVNRCKTT